MSKNINRRWLQAILAALLLVLAGTAWVVFAPSQLGGQAAYVIVNGNSMEPHFHYGDLIVAHRASDYQVGDIVVYHNAELKSLIFHRIIGLNLDHFILKGDNNPWTDSYQPTQAELLGKLWISLPKVGNGIRWLRTPIVLAMVVGATGIILGVMLTARPKRGKKMNKKNKWEWPMTIKNWASRNVVDRLRNFSLKSTPKARQPKTTEFTIMSPDGNPTPSEGKNTRDLGKVIEGGFFALGFAALASLVLGVFAFTRPVSLEVADNAKYEQLGTFSYTTTAPAGVYDTTTVNSGDPLFPKLNCILNLQFDYTLLGDQAQGLTGTHQLTATIMDDTSGWHRTLPLETQTAFSGNTFVSNASFNLCQVEAIVTAMEDVTDLHQSSYSLGFDPHVAITGTIADKDLQAAFEPRLLFMFDQVHFYVVKSDPAIDPLRSTQEGMIQGTRTQANTIPLIGLALDVRKTRVISLIGLGLSLIGLLVLVLFVSGKVHGNQESLVRMKYGAMLVDVRDRVLAMPLPAVDVITMDDLAKLAERQDGTILHEAHGLIHYYFVQGNQVIYRFVLNDDGGGQPGSAQLRMEENLLQGVERGEFRVYYQPIVSLPDGRISAVEALLRWQHPERGLVSAAEFIQAAEKTGLINRLGEWMLEVACTQLGQWQKAGRALKLAVNLSERQLENDPAGFIASVLQKAGMDARMLQIEIPAASLVQNDPVVLANLRKLNQLGVQISLDGFSGQLPLSSLENFQINSVKIDRSLVGGIGNPENAATVSGMISAIKRLGLNVVGEGVETQQQSEFLQEQLCTQAQGYLFSRPVPADEISLLLKKRRSKKETG